MEYKDYLTVGGLTILILGMVFKFVLEIVSKMKNGKNGKVRNTAVTQRPPNSAPSGNGKEECARHDQRLGELERDRSHLWTSVGEIKEEQKSQSDTLSRIDERTRIMLERDS